MHSYYSKQYEKLPENNDTVIRQNVSAAVYNYML